MLRAWWQCWCFRCSHGERAANCLGADGAHCSSTPCAVPVFPPFSLSFWYMWGKQLSLVVFGVPDALFGVHFLRIATTAVSCVCFCVVVFSHDLQPSDLIKAGADLLGCDCVTTASKKSYKRLRRFSCALLMYVDGSRLLRWSLVGVMSGVFSVQMPRGARIAHIYGLHWTRFHVKFCQAANLVDLAHEMDMATRRLLFADHPRSPGRGEKYGKKRKI